MTNQAQNDPMEFLKSMWGGMGFTLPGMVAPTVDTDELAKRIADLKAVEGWLKSNLSLLQMTIHGLEMQRTTLDTLQRMSQAAQEAGEGEAATANPFLNPAAWPMPWNLMGEAPAPAPAAEAALEPPPAKRASSTAKKSKPKG